MYRPYFTLPNRFVCESVCIPAMALLQRLSLLPSCHVGLSLIYLKGEGPVVDFICHGKSRDLRLTDVIGVMAKNIAVARSSFIMVAIMDTELIGSLKQLNFFGEMSSIQMELLASHLYKRLHQPERRSGLGIVFDITKWCNQGCVLCCTDARRIPPAIGRTIPSDKAELTTQQVFRILREIKTYAEQSATDSVFINFGGGEPFLRPDFVEIVVEVSRIFGPESVGFDSNGTRARVTDIEILKDHVSYIGVSIDGLENYHNKWRNTGKENGFRQATSFIQEILKIPGIAEKLEVSTVPTKSNLNQIPELLFSLSEMGVRKYSIHRTMPVGRAWQTGMIDKLLLTANDSSSRNKHSTRPGCTFPSQYRVHLYDTTFR